MNLTWSERLIEAGALVLLVLTPLAFGTTERWSEAAAELLVLGMALVYVIGTVGDWEIRIELPPGWLPATLFLALAAFQLVAGWSSDAHETRRYLLKLGAVAAFSLVCYNTYRTREQIKRAIWTMMAMGTLISLVGLVQRVTGNERLYGIGPRVEYGPPFVEQPRGAWAPRARPGRPGLDVDRGRRRLRHRRAAGGRARAAAGERSRRALGRRVSSLA